MSYHLGSADPDQRAELYADRRDDEPQLRPRRVLAIGITLVVMGVFAGGLWFAYVQGSRHSGGDVAGGDVPLIRADPRPTKVKPAQPGGMEIPDRDKLIYNQSRAVVEHLLPPPEKPMARPAPPPPQPPPQAQASAAPAAPPMPAAAAPEAVPASAAAPAPAPPSARSQQPIAARPEAASPVAPKPTPSRALPAKAGGTRLQLGSVRSEDQARQEWERIKRKNADLLGSLSATAIRADLGDKGVYYRIQTGPVADPAHADRICGELKQRSIGCIIVR